jgi:hypothetical protein
MHTSGLIYCIAVGGLGAAFLGWGLRFAVRLRRSADAVERHRLKSIAQGLLAVGGGVWVYSLYALVPSCGRNWLSVLAVLVVLIPVGEIVIYRRCVPDASAYLDDRP